MNFVELTQTFDRLDALSSRNEMTELLAKLFSQLSEHEARFVSYLLLGELYPPYIGTQFALADKSVIATIAELMESSPDDIKKMAQDTGDLGAVLEKIHRKKNTKIFSIEEIYQQLTSLAKISGKGSQTQKNEMLGTLLKEVSPSEAKYIVRIIIGKLRLGFSDMTLLDAISVMLVGDKSAKKDIENAYNVCADIGLIASTAVRDGLVGIKKISVTVGIPIRPAAAERLPTAHDIIEKIGPCVAQLKLDGFRLQVHIDTKHGKREIYFFSRHLTNMSDAFPELKKALEHLSVKQLIFEGEAIGYNPETSEFLPFQETAKRKRKYEIEAAAQEHPLKLFIFDILYKDGVTLFDEPHSERRKILQKLISTLPEDSPIQLVEEKPIQTGDELETYFLHAIEIGVEGLVVKRPDAPYQAGRRNFNWIKLKRTAKSHLADTIDVVIVGYYYGHGKRASFGIGAILVAVYDAAKDCFETIAKIGTGFSDAEWIDLKKRCDANKEKEKPKNIVCAKELTPDVWVSPEIVCEIYADEITISPLHSAGKTEHHPGYALRFPRFLKYREDKGATEATSVAEIRTLYKNQ